MTGIFASLVFLAAAVIALGAVAGAVLRYRESVMANLAGYRDLATTRDYHFRVFAFGVQPMGMGSDKVRRIGQRPAVRFSVTPAGWRAAA